MEAFEIEKLNCKELEENEMITCNGGVIGIGASIAIGLAIAAGAEIFKDWDNFKRGLKGLPEG